MKQMRIHGTTLTLSVCLLYSGLAIVFLRSFADSAGISEGMDSSLADRLFDYYIAIVVVIGVGLLLLAILYFTDSVRENPAPEWLYAVLAIVLPAAIYICITPIPLL